MRVNKHTRLCRVCFSVATLLPAITACSYLSGCVKSPSTAQKISPSAVKTAAQLFDEGRTAEALASLSATCDVQIDAECTRRISQAFDTLGEPEQAYLVLESSTNKDTAVLGNQLSLELRLGNFQNSATIARKIATTGQMTVPILDDVGLALAFTDPVTMDASLARMPESGQVFRLRGISALAAGKPKAAATWLKQASVNPETDATTWYLLGVARRASGDPLGAKQAFGQAAESKVPSLDAAIAMAGMDASTLLTLDGSQASVREHPGYWRVVAKDRQTNGNTIPAGIALGYALFYDGLPLDAEQKWSSFLNGATGTDRRELLAALFNSAYKRQDSPLAQKWVDLALSVFPGDMWFRKRRAEVLVQQNRLKEAAEQVTTIMPASTAGQGNVSLEELCDLRCRVLLDSGDTAGFQSAIQAYIKAAPQSEFPYLMRAEAALAAGRQKSNLTEAISAYTTATEKSPSDPEAWASLGILQAELGQKDAALESLYHALSLGPRVQDGTPHLKILSLLGASETPALRAFHTTQYRRLRELKDGWPTALKLLRVAGTGEQWLEFGTLALNRHENWLALCAFQQAVKKLPNDPAGYRGLAAARWRRGWFLATLDATLRGNQLVSKKKR